MYVKNSVKVFIKGKSILLSPTQASLWIASDKTEPIIRCIFDNIKPIKIVEKICKYIFKLFFLFLKIIDKGIRKIKAKKSWI